MTAELPGHVMAHGIALVLEGLARLFEMRGRLLLFAGEDVELPHPGVAKRARQALALTAAR